jgi:citrate lyase beta subunit
MLENPRGLANASAIAAASARNEALCLGGEDWAQNSGLTRTRASRELDSVRTAVITTAVEHGLVPIDSVYPWLDDLEGLAEDCRFSRGIGFRGRASTNPRQLAVIQSIYRPDDESLSKARRVLDQLATLEVDGASIYLVDGVITDPAAVFQARLTCLSAGDPR